MLDELERLARSARQTRELREGRKRTPKVHSEEHINEMRRRFENGLDIWEGKPLTGHDRLDSDMLLKSMGKKGRVVPENEEARDRLMLDFEDAPTLQECGLITQSRFTRVA